MKKLRSTRCFVSEVGRGRSMRIGVTEGDQCELESSRGLLFRTGDWEKGEDGALMITVLGVTGRDGGIWGRCGQLRIRLVDGIQDTTAQYVRFHSSHPPMSHRPTYMFCPYVLLWSPSLSLPPSWCQQPCMLCISWKELFARNNSFLTRKCDTFWCWC